MMKAKMEQERQKGRQKRDEEKLKDWNDMMRSVDQAEIKAAHDLQRRRKMTKEVKQHWNAQKGQRALNASQLAKQKSQDSFKGDSFADRIEMFRR